MGTKGEAGKEETLSSPRWRVAAWGLFEPRLARKSCSQTLDGKPGQATLTSHPRQGRWSEATCCQYTLKRSYCGGRIASKVKKHVKTIRAKQELFHPTDENTVSALISQVLVIASQGPNAFRLVHMRFSEVKKSQPKHFTDGFHVSLGLSGLREEVPGIRGK